MPPGVNLEHQAPSTKHQAPSTKHQARSTEHGAGSTVTHGQVLVMFQAVNRRTLRPKARVVSRRNQAICWAHSASKWLLDVRQITKASGFLPVPILDSFLPQLGFR